MSETVMQLRRFNPATANCATALADAFPSSEAVAKEVGWFAAMPEHERMSIYSSIDILGFAANAAYKHNLAAVSPHGSGPAWGVVNVAGSHLFAFRLATDWWAQTTRGVTKVTHARVVAAWSPY